MNSLKKCLAQLYKRKGKNLLSEKEFVFSASIDFRWFTPKEAQKLLELGLKKNLLEKTNGFVKPSFDYKKVDAPMDFKPDRSILDEPLEDVSLFSQILDGISGSSGLAKREVVARINKTQERLGVNVEVAGLVVARDFRLEMDDMIDEVRQDIIGE